LRERKLRLTTVDEIVRNPGEYRKLPGCEKGIVPWWQGMKPDDIAIAVGSEEDQSILHEAEPEHWVACWRTDYFANHADRRADIGIRRPCAAVAR
jgi:hypothetical protein